ncbi:hypothetical protein FAZ69_01050 [Trinickia terrae]|uniref:Uncharacterized protein n=1 Tax=Trinickia terrae TaxID=2571161 RepID=A0A4U1IG16_9BURK|nr:hypothetical protein FAZ69_01050 [Trinickia terrae]
MAVAERSLRMLIEKWIGGTGATSVGVSLLAHGTARRRRCVCIHVERPAGTFALFFFRHDDGSWHVIPPETTRPAMSAC